MWYNVTEINLNIFERLCSKIRKVRRCRPVASNETILAIRQELFFTPVKSIPDIVLLGFWLMLLSWMFISSCTTIYFLQRSLFFLMFIFQWIRYSNVFIRFWLRKEPSIQYVCNWWGDGESSKICTVVYRRRRVPRLMYAYATTLSFFMFFGSIFVL